MSTATSPIDVERYLLQGEGEPGLDVRDYLKPIPSRAGTTRTKPSLEDALLQQYNSTAPPDAQLQPGQLPPTPVTPTTPTQPGLVDKVTGAVSGAVGSAVDTFRGAQPTPPGPEQPITRPSTAPTPVGTVPSPTAPVRTEPAGTLPATPTAPATPSDQPSPLYNMLQKSTSFVRDSMEAAGKTIAGIGAFGFGAATAISDLMWGQLERVAKEGPTALARPHESPTHYRDIFQRMEKTVHDLTPDPKSDIAKNVNKAIGTVTGLIKDVAELPGKGLAYTGILTEDQAKLVSFAIELALFAKLDHGVRNAAPELRSKIADFRTRMKSAKSDADIAGAAEDLATAASKNPRLESEMDQARGKFRDEADKEAGRPPRPKGPDDGGAPSGAYYEEAELVNYRDRLADHIRQWRRDNPDGTFEQMREEAARFTAEQGPKPSPRPTPPEPEVQRTAAEAPPAPEAPRPTPAPEPTRPAAPTETAITRAEPTVQPEAILPTAPQTARPLIAVPPTRPTPEQVRQAVLRPETEQILRPEVLNAPPEAAATVIPETVPAPVSTGPAAVAAVTPDPEVLIPPRVYEPGDFRKPAHDAFAAAESASTPAERTTALSTLKGEALNTVPRNMERGLRQLGFDEETIAQLVPELRKVRAKKAGTETLQQIAEKPAVQTAATEAALDNAPVGTEVEIPAPSEPVVDSSPAIEKPKRKRRIVKAQEPELPALTDEQRAEMYATGQAPRAPAGSIPAGIETPNARYYQPANLDDMGARARVGFDSVRPLENATPLRAPVQLRFTNFEPELFGKSRVGAKPDAIFIDTTGLNTRTSLADIEKQMQSGRMSEEVGQAMIANLERQAQLFFRNISEAHRYTGQELTRMATQIAAETGVDLYVKKGKNYELVPKDVVRTDAKLNRGDDLAATPVSKEDAGAYVESKTSDIGPAQIREIVDAIERGEDITHKLPSELIPHYTEMRARDRAGISTSERRAWADTLLDIWNVSREILRDESGAINLTSVRMAAQRLQSDFAKMGKSIKEFLIGANPNTVAMFERYLDRINNPPPPDAAHPRNMRFDPTAILPGDTIVKHRVVDSSTGLMAVPLWRSEVHAIQAANDLAKPGGHMVSLKTPYWQHEKAGTQFLRYAYRAAQKNVDAAIADLHKDMQTLSKGFSIKSLENIGANGYQRQGSDGQRILTYNKVTPKPLTPAEQRLQATIYGIYADAWNQINESRIASGEQPIPHVGFDYQLFGRTFSVLERLGMAPNLISAKPAEILAAYNKHKTTNFPYSVARKGTFYTAEMNALKLLDTYMQSALKQIHLSPFLAKLYELVETNLPDPVTNQMTWSLKDNKPGLYQELSSWHQFLTSGTNAKIPGEVRHWLNVANRNLGYAMLSYGLRSGAIQITTIRNTGHTLGWPTTLKGAVDHILDITTGGTQWDFAMRNSHVLPSRKFIDAYNSVASALASRNPRDVITVMSRGNLSEMQQLVGGVGMQFLQLPDMQMAVSAWNTAYKQATNKLGYNHKDSVRYADDVVVRTQGSSMPGDLAGVQRNALGRALTQFQSFAISDWNFLTQEVFGGTKQMSRTQMFGSILKWAFATQAINEILRAMNIQPSSMEFIRDWSKGAMSGLSNFLEPIPILSSTRYGRGMSGPLLETARDLTRAVRGDPLTSNPFREMTRSLGISDEMAKVIEPAAELIGIPGIRQMAKYGKAQQRGETIYDSLMGWYSQETGGGRSSRSERGKRRSR